MPNFPFILSKNTSKAELSLSSCNKQWGFFSPEMQNNFFYKFCKFTIHLETWQQMSTYTSLHKPHYMTIFLIMFQHYRNKATQKYQVHIFSTLAPVWIVKKKIHKYLLWSGSQDRKLLMHKKKDPPLSHHNVSTRGKSSHSEAKHFRIYLHDN